MSFFWSTSYTPPKEVPPPPKPVQKEVVVEKTEPYVSPRSVPTADAFKSVQITHTPRKRVELSVEIVPTKPVSVGDACTPVQSPYDMPEVETEFTFDNVENVDPYDTMYTTTEPCTPVSVTNKRSEELYNFQERIHRLESLFNRGLYQHLKVVHQGVYKDSVLNGGHVASPDREELDARENYNLYNSDAAGRLLELQHKYADLVAQSRQFSERLEQLTSQLADFSLDL
jgi:hypothetical protein